MAPSSIAQLGFAGSIPSKTRKLAEGWLSDVKPASTPVLMPGALAGAKRPEPTPPPQAASASQGVVESSTVKRRRKAVKSEPAV